MRFFFSGLILTIIFSSTVFGQQSSRRQKNDELKQVNTQLKILREQRKEITNQQIELLLKIKSVSEQDSAEAEKVGAKAIRLFPCCELNELVRGMDEINSSDIPFNIEAELGVPVKFSSYLISDLNRKADANMIEGLSTFEYRDGTLNIIKKVNHGFIIDVGNRSFESINEKDREITALAEYQPPTDEENIKSEFVSDKLIFRQNVPLTVGNTYFLRAVKYGNPSECMDSIFALKVHRTDPNGSIILFIKAIKIFEPPKLKNPEREEYDRVFNLGLVAKLKEELRAKGFKDIQIETTDKTVTLKGFVPNGKSAEAIEIAKNIYFGITVKSELFEK